MPTETLRTVGRNRNITATLRIERWVQKNGGKQVVFASDGDLNRLDALADSRTAAGGGAWWFDAPSIGASDYDDSWWAVEIRIWFKRVGQASGQWHTLDAELKSFVEAGFPNETIYEANERVERPNPSDDFSKPARFVYWEIEEE